MNKGVFMLSLDTELAWGMVDKPLSLINHIKHFENTRKAIDGIIELLEKYQISATWAVVGSLLLDKPSFDNEFVNYIIKDLEDPIKKQYIDLLKAEKIWCGKDILKKIKSSFVPQEIGSHSFSHFDFGGSTVSKNKAKKEFLEGMNALRLYGELPKSFVFPRNNVNYLSELKCSGFRAYRGVAPSWYIKAPEKLKKVCHFLDDGLAISPPVITPIHSNGLTNIPASMFYYPMDGYRNYIPLSGRVIKAKKGIQKAVKEKKIFHLWFHPFNIATNQNILLSGLEEIFKMVEQERNNGNLEVMTMGELVQE